jgi:hypothetical protein
MSHDDVWGGEWKHGCMHDSPRVRYVCSQLHALVASCTLGEGSPSSPCREWNPDSSAVQAVAMVTRRMRTGNQKRSDFDARRLSMRRGALSLQRHRQVAVRSELQALRFSTQCCPDRRERRLNER